MDFFLKILYFILLYKEIWIEVPWYEWYYKISSFGNILNTRMIWRWNKNKTNVLSKRFNKKWYVTCLLSKNWISKTYLVHRLVILSFEWYSNLQVNHKDWNKLNNTIYNLEYVTNEENIRHAVNTGLIKKWEKCLLSKVISYYNLKWEFIWRVVWVRNLARILWLDNSNISKVCRWDKKSYKWYIFKYI